VKVLLELLGDVAELLKSIDDIEDISINSRTEFETLLGRLAFESNRISKLSLNPGVKRDVIFQRALEAIAKNRLDDAESILLGAIKKFPKDTELFNHLGLVAWEKGEMEDAVTIYEKAMSVGFPEEGRVNWFSDANRPFLRAMEGYALALYQLERFGEALPMFDSLAEMNPEDYGGCRYMAGELRHFRGEIADAILSYEKVDPEPAVLYNLALAYFQVGELNKAISTTLRAFISNPFIATRLIGLPLPTRVTFGYLDSDPYAEEFLAACSSLWTDKGKRFLSLCFEHPLVQANLSGCIEHMKTTNQEDGESWFNAAENAGNISSLVEEVRQKISNV